MNQKSAYVNSADRYSGTAENFFVIDTGRFSLPPQYVKVISANIPYSWYNITTANNEVSVSEPPSVTIVDVTIPVGNYTGATLATALQTTLNGAGLTHTYAVTYSASTNLFTISANGNFILYFTASNNMAMRLGFVSGSQTTSAMSVTAPNQAAFSDDNEIFICSNLVSGIDNGYTKFDNIVPATNDQILAVVTLNASPGATINYTATSADQFFNITGSAYGKIQSPYDITQKTINFYLQLPSGDAINLNGLNWSMTLLFSNKN
jgi:hypothetical protein